MIHVQTSKVYAEGGTETMHDHNMGKHLTQCPGPTAWT